jgi:glycosyltransferase involved in cell wall biosynthesis
MSNVTLTSRKLPTSNNPMSQPLVSVIVPTYNSAESLVTCLQSIKDQTYPKIELIVVDNASKDTTQEVASKFTEHVYNLGPERSAQRNFGVKKATGQYVVIIDSDMELAPEVIEQGVEEMQSNPKVTGLVIPEESFGIGFWAACKRLERSFYLGVPYIEAARFFLRDLYLELGGYDETLVSGEDWDLSQRASNQGRLSRVTAFIRHNEGQLSLTRTLKKKYYYAKQFVKYQVKNQSQAVTSNQISILGRYALFFRDPKKLWANPVLALGMLFMKTAEFAVGGFGLLVSKLSTK